MPKGQRPPPFLPPPTSVDCGGDDSGDPNHFSRLLSRFTDVLLQVTSKTVWSLECLGIQHELDLRYQMLMEVGRQNRITVAGTFTRLFDDANRHIEDLEEHFFSTPREHTDILWLGLLSGWIGPSNPDSVKILDAVRSSLLDIYCDVRQRDWLALDNKKFVDSVVARVEVQLDSLFSICGTDEATWFDIIRELADSGRMIKLRAYRLTAQAPS